MKRGHVQMTREQLARVGHLLNMYYKPSEIAEEIGCHTDTVYRSFLPAGCPHERDERGHIWIIGTAFRDWARVPIQCIRAQRCPKALHTACGVVNLCGCCHPLTNK